MHQRTAIGKMSDERLKVRLVQAGHQEEVVAQMDHQTMMRTLATYIGEGTCRCSRDSAPWSRGRGGVG